jgi:hypothetical protein
MLIKTKGEPSNTKRLHAFRELFKKGQMRLKKFHDMDNYPFGGRNLT